jgi:anti-anti-sigma regulatory factor
MLKYALGETETFMGEVVRVQRMRPLVRERAVMANVVMFAPDGRGYVVRLEGRGTMKESPALRSFVRGVLDHEQDAEVVLDLSMCKYLDSTLQGCLVGLHESFPSERFTIAGSPETIAKLFGPTHLERLFTVLREPPRCQGEWCPLPTAQLSRTELGQHLLGCHRRLAEAGGPEAKAFAHIAEQIALELENEAD